MIRFSISDFIYSQFDAKRLNREIKSLRKNKDLTKVAVSFSDSLVGLDCVFFLFYVIYYLWTDIGTCSPENLSLSIVCFVNNF